MAKKKAAVKTLPAKAAKKAPAKVASRSRTPTPKKRPSPKEQVKTTAATKKAARKKAAASESKKTKRAGAKRVFSGATTDDAWIQSADAYARHKKRAGERQKQLSEDGRDIAGDMPQVTDPKARARVSKSLRKFCDEVLPERFHLGWSEDHLTAIKKMERAILTGDNFAIAMPRGTGKTTLVIAAVLWAIVSGHKRYIALIGADRDAATKLLDGIKVELETNDRLLDLFPEAAYPIRRLEGIANRCRGQLYQGNRTYIRWTSKHIQFANVPLRGEVPEGGRTASMAVVETAGIRGKIRGMQQALPTGEIVRPDCFVVDDPQTDTSAKSRTQVNSRLNVITGTCPGLAGPGESISGFCTCTVIEPDDVADQLLNPEKFPDFHGERFQLVYEWPTETELWEEYGNVYRESMATELGMAPCNTFVKKHWKRLHAGSRVAWEVRKRKDEVSPLQHAYNLLLRLGDMFWQEYQNKPKGADDAEDLLSVDEIQVKVNGYPRLILPPVANLVTGFIDVQGECLFYAVIATARSSFDAWLLDYGTWPRQTAKYYSKRKLGKRLSQIYKGRGQEGRIRQGIMDLTADLATTDYTMPDGRTSMRIKRLGIDAAWGKSSPIVYACAIESPHRSIMLPTFGRGLDAMKMPMEFWTAKPGETLGVGYAIRPRPGGGLYALLDSNYWKSFVHARLAVPMGDAGSLSLFQPEMITTHRLIAEHYRSETRSETSNGSRVVHIWTLPDNKPDNDLFDATAGAMAMAGIEGAKLADLTVRRAASSSKRPRRRTTIKA
ncbi:terminase gpA endonuclease subunit [Aureliella helgolandensis]|uniref:Phage terminase large subunit (GpA) n=1 Tax=Aureliella helgolandensis TaxID=2527968 RepID=A0A518G4Q4_9BACT|nr:terminase gpA endonuclease subunit [Aureliella helgolandensis]QDV23574.1 Phage terminase large subunit (GpA) [Aureliella helgolandensis]